MPRGFLDILSTLGVKAAQATYGSAGFWNGRDEKAGFGDAETAFIAARDSFYMASVAENGWPYVQHRGGPKGFLKILDERTLGFADFRGNRQYISTGNLAANDRAALILVDYPGRRRLKILAHAEVQDVRDDPHQAARLATPGYKAQVERAMFFHLATFDWNCQQHITPRFTQVELTDALTPIRDHIAHLEAENAALREHLERATHPI
jgi:predicted pyridoxine 5'-phosphate oxidase superfamily flavin-nucleotide-binding protein